MFKSETDPRAPLLVLKFHPLTEQLIQKLSSNAPDFTEFEWQYPAKLGPPGVNAVVEPLNWRNTFLRVLRLSNQQLGDVGVSYVAKSMKSNRTIELLDISGNSVTSKGVECLVDALLWNEGRFLIGGVVSTPAMATSLFGGPNSSNARPVSVINPHTTLSTRGGSALRHLDLSHNLIDFSGCGHIARLITNAESISTLLLNNNLLNDVGLTTIANALALNCSLTRLDLQFNPVSQTMAVGPIFANVLETSNYTLTQLDLGGARISESDLMLIQSALTRNALLHDERLSSVEHAPPRENAFKRMEIGTTASLTTSGIVVSSSPANSRNAPNDNGAARLHVFHADVLSPAAILRLVVTPLGANIVSLIITDCNLTRLPPQLCLLGTHLEILDVRRNKLTELPLEIRGFFKLKRLHLAHNYLQHLPPQLTSLHSLDAISLQGNPLQWIPQEVVSHAEIEDFPPADTRLFKFLAEASSSTNAEDHSLHGKLMILGQVHSGKTSLCQILDSSFGAEVSHDATAPQAPASSEPREGWSHEMPRYISTEGVCARNILIQGSKYSPSSEASLPPLYSRARLSMSNQSVSAQAAAILSENSAVMRRANFVTLEAGGSNIYAAAHSIFFRPDLLYLVTVDLTKLAPEHSRETISELKNTIHSIRTMVGTQTVPSNPSSGSNPSTSSRASGPHIAIVGTFEDLLPTPQALIDALTLLKVHFEPYVVEIFSISNKSSRGLSILRDRVLFWSIKARLLASPQLGSVSTVARVLKSYSSIRPFISKAELEQICKVYGVGAQSSCSDLPISVNANYPKIGASSTMDGDAEPELPPLDIPGAVSILEQIGAVTMFHHDPQLECYAFIDIQFIANVFSDIMAAADADGYIYRSHVPPLLWMDCRRHASMKSLFDWCRLFGLALDCGDTHYIVPSLLNAAPQQAVYNAAWPAMELIDGVSSRPHVTSPSRARPPMSNSGSSAAYPTSFGSLSPSSSAATLHAPVPTSGSSSASSYSSSSSGPVVPAHHTGSTSPGLVHSHHQILSSSSASLQSTSTHGSTLRTSPAVEKAAKAYQRELSLVSCNEWPVLVRGIATDFVPALVFSHLNIAVFSLPKIQRCAWWRNGFIVRRDNEFVKVTREFSGHSIASPSSFAVPYKNISGQGTTSGGGTTTTYTPDTGSVKILVEARNDSTYTYSKALLEEVCGCMDTLLQRWYPQFEFKWAVTWSHPWLSDDETPALSLLQVQDALSRGPIRTPTQIGPLTIREELLLPEVVSHASFYTKLPKLVEISESEVKPSADGSNIDDEAKTNGLILVPPTSADLAVARIPTSSSNVRVYKDPTDGSLVRFREVPENALPSTALTLSVLRNERVATLHRVYNRPSGLTIFMPKGGSLNDVLERTYNDSPLPWAARFRIAVDIALALRYVHSQVPVMAIQGLDAHSVLLNDNFSDPHAAGPIARIDLSATNSQSWLHSIFAPRPFYPAVVPVSAPTSASPPGVSPVPTTTSSGIGALSPHAHDIYSLGVLLLQLWRNEPLDDLLTRVRDKLPPVPFYSPESVGFMAYEQLIAACVCDDPLMRPQIDGVITKLHAISVHLDLTSATKLLASHEPARRWRKIKTVQVSGAAASAISFSISTLCKSSSSPFTKPDTASTNTSGVMTPSALQSPTSSSANLTTGANLTSSTRSHFLDETIVWAGGVDGVLYGMPFPMPNMITAPGTAIVGAAGPSSISNGVSSPGPSSSGSPTLTPHSAQINLAAMTSLSTPSRLGMTPASHSLHWSTLSTSMLDSASIQYRMTTFPPDMRQTRRRILATATSARHIWCLLNTVTASVLDPARLALVAQVEIGACLSIASHNDLVFTGGTNGVLSVFDGSSCKRLRQREISKLPITAIAANGRFIWCALTDDPGKPSALVCLDMNTLVEETRYSHTEEDTVTSICLTPIPSSENAALPVSDSIVAATALPLANTSNPALAPPFANSTPTLSSSGQLTVPPTAANTEIMWTGGYSGTVFTFKVTRSPFIDMSDVKIEPLMTHRNVHKTRILNFQWNGDFVYSASNDSIAAWKPDASATASHLTLPTVDIASFTTLEKNCLITGHKNGSITIWASV